MSILTNFLWRLVALIVSRPWVRARIISRAARTPYSHIRGADGSLYMARYWLFNPYSKDAQNRIVPARISWLPSIRVHHIRRPDTDRDLHDHPWNARTIVLGGWYEEERPLEVARFRVAGLGRSVHLRTYEENQTRLVYVRRQGYTGRLLFEEYHRISEVSPGGVFTLFFTWPEKGDWGFSVDGVKVPHEEYLAGQNPIIKPSSVGMSTLLN